MTATIIPDTHIMFGIPKSREFVFRGFPEGLLKHEFSNDDFAKVHVHTPEGSVLSYIVRVEEEDGKAVVSPAYLLQDLALSLDTLAERVLEWGEKKGITGSNGKATLLTQLAKTQEELDETIEAATVYADAVLTAKAAGACELATLEALHEEVVDGLGDQMVTLILAAELAGVSLAHCLNHAYNIIKNRKGKMVDGQFVKEA